MFTGIVEATGRVVESGRGRLRIDAPFKVREGASVAVNGVCLTAHDGLRFDVVPETLKKTTLGTLKSGDRVNLERARRAGGRLDGHVVQGHVEGVGVVEKAGATLTVRYPAANIVPQGAIAVDGVSLTVVDVDGDRFTVALIPFTRKHTTLGRVKRGDRVNIETDVMTRRLVSRVTRQLLKRAGFA